MAGVFDTPVTTHGSGEPLYIHGQAADVVTHLDGLFPATKATRGYYSNRHESLAQLKPRQTLGRGHLKIRSCLLATMTLFSRHMLTRFRHFSVELLLDVIDGRLMQRFLVSFQCQHIVGLAL